MLQKSKEKLKNSLSAAKETFSKSDGTLKDHIYFGFNVSFGVIKSLFYFFIIVGILLGALGAGIGAGYFAYLVSDTEVPEKKELQNKISDVELVSSISYAGGEKIADIRSDLIRTNVASENISQYVKDALIATEDEYFNVHKGVVPKAVLRALISEATGSGSSGGSTITQQLVKQQVLTSETSYKRKANEIVLALHLEKYFSKDEIITAYLNVSPFGRNNQGQNIAGVQEAAEGIFNTTADKLNLPQAAFIAGLPQSPIEYTPYLQTGELKDDFSLGLARKDQVLFNLYREGYIDKKEYEEAVAYDLVADFRPTQAASDETNGYLYYYVHDQAVQALMPIYYEADGLTAEDISNAEDLYNKYYKVTSRELQHNGYQVQTTIDKSIYQAMQEAARTNANWLYNGEVEVGSVLLDNQSGRIISFIGGRDYNRNKLNHAFQSRRSPGSTIKPILAYAPAIDVGLIGSESMLSNFSRKYKGTDTDLMNFSRVPSSGFETVRHALTISDNVPVVELYQGLLEVADPKTYYDKMNMDMSEAEFTYESIPVGGTDTGPTIFAQTNAYATLANNGAYAQGYAIEKITDNNGEVIYQHNVEPVQVFLPATASIMNDMMRDVITKGTGAPARNSLYNMGSYVANADWVGKTGTSEYNDNLWFIASTPKVTISSWVGYSEGAYRMPETYSNNNMTFWSYITNAAYQANPDLFGASERFTLDSTVIKASVSDFTGQLPGKVYMNGSERTVPGKTVTSLWAKDGPSNSQFRFGIGGTDAQYQSTWDKAYPKPAPAKKTTTRPTNNENKEDEKEDSNDNKEESKEESKDEEKDEKSEADKEE